jgi:hypothetical protein
MIVTTSCEREVSDAAVLATFPTTAGVFTDNPVGLTDEFFISFDPAGGANTEGFGTDENEAYEGFVSIRIDVPAPNDPDGSFIGGIFRDRGEGRNLTGYDALTFWAKGSTTAIFEAGFGTDFFEDKYPVSNSNLQLSTDWKKYILPIPDASKLVQERGMFFFSAGTGSTSGMGYTIWIDEIKFEKLGTIAQPRPKIQNGNNAQVQNFIGGNLQISGLTQTFNTPTQGDVTVNAAPAYYEFKSSNPEVAVVNDVGFVNINGSGNSTITATLAGNEAQGSLKIESLGNFTIAPAPTRSPESVISIFSNTYNNRPVDFYNGFYAPFQTTTSSDFTVNSNDVLYYLDFNFVGIEFNQNVPTINAKLATHLHFDVFIPNEPPGSTGLRIDLVDFGADASFGGGDDTSISKGFTSGLVAGEWIPIDFDITGLNPKTNLGQIILADVGGTVPPSEFYVDNIYFYREGDENITPESVTLPLDFELSNPANYAFSGFEGAETTVVDNPFSNGINTSATVMESIKTNGALFFAGTSIDLDEPIDFSSTQTLKMKVYSPKANIPIRFALETSGGGNQVFVEVNTTKANEWEEIEFDFSGVYNSNLKYQRLVVFFEFIDGLQGDGSTYYFDDIKLIN